MPDSGTEKHILVVEDDKLLRSLLVKKLRAEGFSVHDKLDATGAFAALREKRPDLILLDLILPGTDGFGILEQLKSDEQYASIPVIILTNLGQEADVERAMSLGAKDFFIKADLTLDEIVSKVHAAV